jgi:hypothetical protein
MRSQHNIIIGADLKGIQKEVGTIGALFKTQFALEAGAYVAQLAQELAAVAQESEKVNKALKFAGGGPATIKKMADATGGLVTNLELASLAAESLAKGINEGLLDEVAAFATTFSAQTGRTFADAYQKAETAFINPTKESFRALGLDFQAYTDLVKEGFTQQEAAAQLFIDKMNELGDPQGSAAMAAQRTKVAWENIKENVANFGQDLVVGTAAGFAAMWRMATSLDAWMEGYLYTQQRILNEWSHAPKLIFGDAAGPTMDPSFNFTNFPGIQRPAPKATGKTAAAAGGSRAQISPIALAAKDMATFTVELGKNTEAIRSNVFEGQMLLDNYAAMQADINATNALVDYFGASLSQAFEAALFSGRDFFEVMGDYLKNFVQQMVAALATAVALKGILSIFGLGNFSTVGSIFSGLMGFPKLAEGGLVTKPTLALIGERGPEAVVPLGRMGGMGGMEVATVRVSGNDLLLAIQRTNFNQGRAGARGGYQ